MRALKVYTRGLSPNNSPDLLVEMWYNKGGSQIEAPDTSQIVKFHQTGSSGSKKQGFSLPVIPSQNHSYRLTVDGVDNNDMVVEFSDVIVGNRFDVEYINLSLNGFKCGTNGLVSCMHDRSFIWSGDKLLANEAWGKSGACASTFPADFDTVDCSSINDGRVDEIFVETLEELCNAARCGEHGHCTATYLGGSSLPVTSNACICDEGWSGPLCQYNPCESITCSGKGTCVATSDTTARCECIPGYSGEDCGKSCEDQCIGEYPYGCATSVDNIIKYGCNKGGGCYYLRDGEDYVVEGFCTYKEATEELCLCGGGIDNECELSMPCLPDGSCPPPHLVPDSVPCNALPLGVCESGSCVSSLRLALPSRSPSTPSPTSSPVQRQRTHLPTKRPSVTSQNNEETFCECTTCTKSVWNTLATDNDGSYSCGARISWLQSALPREYPDEPSACLRVSNEFPALCTCSCGDDDSTKPTISPSDNPVETPTVSPSIKPTTQLPTKSVSRSK